MVADQSGTKPNLVAKILAIKFDVFLLYILCFKKYVQYESNDNVTKYYGSVIPHVWDVSFGKFGGLPTVVDFFRKLTSKAGTN